MYFASFRTGTITLITSLDISLLGRPVGKQFNNDDSNTIQAITHGSIR